MNNEKKKFSHILPAYLSAYILSISLLLFTRWILAIKFDLLALQEEVWEIWLPFIVSSIFCYLALNKRIKILEFKENKDNKHFVYIMFASITVILTSVFSQSLLINKTSTLTELESVNEISLFEKSRYYRINKFDVAKHYGVSNTYVNTSSSSNNELNVNLLFAFPIVENITDDLTNEIRVWYGISFYKSINKRLDTAEREKIYNRFYEASVKKVDNYNFFDLNMFKRLPHSKARDNFLDAVKNRQININENNLIILVPTNETIDEIVESDLSWIIWVSVIGFLIFCFLVLIPSLDENEFERQKKGVIKEDENSISWKLLLIPQKDFFVAPVFIIANGLVFLLISIYGVDFISPSAIDLLSWGANRRFEVVNGEWWRLLSSMFLHGGIMHLLLNCYGLLISCIYIEPVLGGKRLFILYLITGLCGSLSSIWWYENTVSVGASGAIFGIFGAILGLMLTNAFTNEGKKAIFIALAPYIVISLLYGLTGGIDNAAHLGGLISGALLGMLVFRLTIKGGKFNLDF